MYCDYDIILLKGRDFMAKNSPARIAANARYNQKAYDDMKIHVKKGDRERIKLYADGQGMSLNNFVCSCLSYCIKHNIDVTAVPALTETLPEDREEE